MIILSRHKYEKCLKWILAHFDECSDKYRKTIEAVEKYEERHFPMAPKADDDE